VIKKNKHIIAHTRSTQVLRSELTRHNCWAYAMRKFRPFFFSVKHKHARAHTYTQIEHSFNFYTILVVTHWSPPPPPPTTTTTTTSVHLCFLGATYHLIPVGGEIFRTCPDRPSGPPSLLHNGYQAFPGVKERPGRDADPSPLLVPW